jgi:hypothetical protein
VSIETNLRKRMMGRLLGPLAVLATTVTLSSVGAEAQCCGDCNADRTVTVDEVLTTVNFALAGCSAEGPPAVVVRPLEEVSVDGLPTVTAINGTGHTDHHPLLYDLEADTDYQFRVQGTAADGTIYVGDNISFRSAESPVPGETDLASLEAGAQVVDVSSNFGGTDNDGTWGANKALDGSAATAWASFGDGNDAFVEVQLAAPAMLSSIEVWTRLMADGSSQIFAFTVTVDGTQVLGPFSLPDALRAYAFDVDVRATSLRLDVVDSSGGNTGLIEFAAYGTPVRGP